MSDTSHIFCRVGDTEPLFSARPQGVIVFLSPLLSLRRTLPWLAMENWSFGYSSIMHTCLLYIKSPQIMSPHCTSAFVIHWPLHLLLTGEPK